MQSHPKDDRWYSDRAAPRTIAYYIMYDTQPFDEKQWSSPPLAANIVKMPPFGEVIMARKAREYEQGAASGADGTSRPADA